MTQEAFIEVNTYLVNKNRLTKWIRPVIVKRLKLLFDVFCWVTVSRDTDLDFEEMEAMDPEEYLAWIVYGGHVSYMSTHGKRSKPDILRVQRWVAGMLVQDRQAIIDTIRDSRSVGEMAEMYQAAAASLQGEDKKKADGSEPLS